MVSSAKVLEMGVCIVNNRCMAFSDGERERVRRAVSSSAAEALFLRHTAAFGIDIPLNLSILFSFDCGGG